MTYAKLECERKFLVRAVPPGATHTSRIVDRYVAGTRLRLREMTSSDGTVVRKLGQKIRPDGDASRIAHTTIYLDEDEWATLASLPGVELRKTRHHFPDGLAVDELADGTLLAEVDGGDALPTKVPPSLDVIREVTGDEAWTGAAIAARLA
ncbi:hypothetical protein [Nocardioides sp. Kera G14]|uniref:hypothetical protein n=1 Tax=Nocardioides sp. Kera G14 TaxID=2884264 RepID=UPI001D115B24|nr:hypothetical protein [Nocardioides sp. Kera G14]UDY25062.1 hypothetical protein LH076_07160 [Nocardioides sp. Kera G14]